MSIQPKLIETADAASLGMALFSTGFSIKQYFEKTKDGYLEAENRRKKPELVATVTLLWSAALWMVPLASKEHRFYKFFGVKPLIIKGTGYTSTSPLQFANTAWLCLQMGFIGLSLFCKNRLDELYNRPVELLATGIAATQIAFIGSCVLFGDRNKVRVATLALQSLNLALILLGSNKARREERPAIT